MKYIQSLEELDRNISDFYDSPVVAVDTETTGLDPHKAHLRLIQLSNQKETLVIDLFKANKLGVAEKIKPILQSTEQVKIFQNAKFDLKFFKYELEIDVERIFDTMLASQIISNTSFITKGEGVGHPKGFHGLEQIAERYADLDISKEQQNSDWSGELSDAQIQYAATDVECLFPIRDKQIEVLKEEKLVRCAKIEFEAVLPTAWLELCGFFLDYDQWMEVANQALLNTYPVAKEMDKIMEPYIKQQTMFDLSAINYSSIQQVQKYFTMAGIPMPKSTKEFYLLPLAKKYPLIKLLLEYRKHMKNYTSFGEGFQEFISPVSKRVHADFFQLGTETGRYATKNPNLAQIPADKEHRNCFKAEPGHKLVGADFSQEELRLIAYLSQDKKMIAAFNSGADFHTNTAAMLWNIPLDQVPDYERGLAKRANFGLTYGAGADKFAGLAGIPVPEAREVRDMYFRTYCGMNRWIMYQKQKVVGTRCARTPSGRIIRYEFDETVGYEVSQAQRCAVNGPIQGGGSDILKRTMRILYDNVKHHGDKIKLVNVVHDQLDLEIADELVDEGKDILIKSMVTAGEEFIKDVPVKVDSKVGFVWEK